MSDQKRIPAVWEKLNLDTHTSRLQAGSYVDGYNFVLYSGRDKKALIPRKFKGTREIPFNAPAGVNTGLGTYWDETGDTLIAFIHNDQGNHFILWMFPLEPTARVIEIPQINLQIGKPVVGCSFVNQELLVFTDGGDYPKCINLPRADGTSKKSIVRIYLPVPPQGQVVDSRVLSVRTILDGLPQTPFIALAPSPTSQQIWDFGPMMAEFARLWNLNSILASAFTATACSDYIELEATAAGMWSVGAISTDTYPGGIVQTPVTCFVEYVNRYNDAFTFEQIALSTPAPRLAPSAILAYDDKQKSNLIDGVVLQFQYAFRLKDKQRTLTSAISDIALPVTSQCQNAGSQYNCVDIGFDDPWLSDPAMRGEIEFIDLFVRQRNDGSWFKVLTLEKWQWIYDRSYRFYNNGTYTASDQAYNEAGNTFVPPIANALVDIVGTDNNLRIAFGGITEGDGTPCLDVVLSPRIDGSVGASADTASVIGDLRIFSGYAPGTGFADSQPIVVYGNDLPVYGGMGLVFHEGNPQDWTQQIPLGGFVIYAAGTDMYTITTQIVASVPVSGGFVQPTLWTPPTGSPAIGRNVYDGTQTGGAGNNVNDTHRAAIRDAMTVHSVRSTFRLDGLVPGNKYVLRMASNKIDSGDGTGIYDINNPDPVNSWQKTSGDVKQFGDVNNAIVKSGLTECTITVPLNGGGTTIDIGTVWVWDFTCPDTPPLTSIAVKGYCFDDNGTHNSSAIRSRGVPAEKQLIGFGNFAAGLPVGGPVAVVDTPLAYLNAQMRLGVCYTDHNGYFSLGRREVPGRTMRAAWLGVNGVANAAGAFIGITVTGAQVSNFSILNDASDDKWEGDLATPVLPPPTLGNLFPGVFGGAKEYIIPNTNQGAQFRRTRITARFLTLSGSPIAGVVAILENGKVSISDLDGYIGIGSSPFYAYGDTFTNRNDRTVDDLIYLNSGPCNIQFTGGNFFDVEITQFIAGNQWSDTVPYEIGDIFGLILGVGRGRGFHRGGSYATGYYLGRWNGDRTPVKQQLDVRFAGLNEDLNKWLPLRYTTPGTYIDGIGVIEYQINGPVPDAWIGRWDFIQFCMTQDNTSQWMLQWVASQVLYSSRWNTDPDEPVVVDYGTGTASEIYIELTDSLTRYKDIHSDSQVGYLWQQGDMLRILTDRFGQPLFDGSNIEVPITGQRGKWITIAATSAVPRLYGGEVIEIFTPRKPTEASVFTFYDIPGARILVDRNTGAWSQTTGILDKGDTWVLPRKVPIRPDTQNVEPASPWQPRQGRFASKWISDFYPSTDWGRGKPWFQDPDAISGEKRGSLMRYTDGYKQGTNINGLNFVNGLNFRIAENWLGAIVRMMRIEDVIFCLCENGAFSVYVGIEQLQTTQAGAVQALGGILGTVRPFAHRYGCVDPQAVVMGTTNILYFSRATGAIVQYNSNQLQDVAEQNNCSSYFQEKGLTMPKDTPVCGGYDMVHKEFIFTFAPHIHDDGFNQNLIDGESIKYFDPANAFTSKLTASPDCWGKTRQRLWSFFDGKLWEHHATDRYNEIYGQNVPMRITTPFIPGWSLNHQWQNVTYRGSGENWYAVVVSHTGETMVIDAGRFSKKEIYETASIDGKISGAEITIEMIHDRNGYAELVAIWTNQKITGAAGQLS